ncbi:hypothetical protein SHKM778_74090 [Streptomyces sp. KM77-8]|uniref:Uncharacterized protein n=1 Tax=Streptomyces haneummycinicus TaxID=3074435 RepID=A0AAT9HU25_9ACTN
MAVSGLLVAAPSGSAGTDAAAIDNIVPTANYYVGCLRGEANGTVCQTDNATLTYYMDSGGSDKLEARDKDIVRTMLADEYSPTDLVISYDSTPRGAAAPRRTSTTARGRARQCERRHLLQ